MEVAGMKRKHQNRQERSALSVDSPGEQKKGDKRRDAQERAGKPDRGDARSHQPDRARDDVHGERRLRLPVEAKKPGTLPLENPDGKDSIVALVIEEDRRNRFEIPEADGQRDAQDRHQWPGNARLRPVRLQSLARQDIGHSRRPGLEREELDRGVEGPTTPLSREAESPTGLTSHRVVWFKSKNGRPT